MKRIHKKIYVGTVLLALFLMGGCNKVLQETPRSSYTPEYFKTSNGVLGGITALYASLRGIGGQAYYCYTLQENGTDESTWGASGADGGQFQAHDFSVSGLVPTASTTCSNVLWNLAFTYINTASGVLEYGSTAGVSASYLAEARFFRAYYYFLLVQDYGGVPLNLGTGRLKFNISTSRTSVRDSVSTVYTKAIFPDLDTAIAHLPSTQRATGIVTLQVAQLVKAKAYLTYAWWLANPNNIPTYPYEGNATGSGPRTDPDGHTSQWYFQQAYNLAVTVMQTPGSYGLQSSYYLVNAGANDYNNECMLYADHTQQNVTYNNSSLTYASGNWDSYASWFQTWNYPNITSSSSATSWSNVNSVQRASMQWGGRPWVRNAPTIEVFTKTFADKTNDSRYDGTFSTVYRNNMTEAGVKVNNVPATVLYNANYLPIYEGSPVLTFLNDDVTGIDYSNSVYKSGVGAGVLPGRSDYVVSPSAYNRILYPGIWKLGPYRTDNGTGLGNPNGGTTRPYTFIKFSELFFIAAEAALEGATTTAVSGTYANDGTARGLINVIRARAGKWSFSNANNAAYVADNSAAMVAATPATVTLGYLLAERSREYYGEGYRRRDLVRTQRWGLDNQEGYNYSTFSVGGTSTSDHTAKTYTRYISSKYYLLPVPQGQIDAMEMSDAAKKAYQNPAYQ